MVELYDIEANKWEVRLDLVFPVGRAYMTPLVVDNRLITKLVIILRLYYHLNFDFRLFLLAGVTWGYDGTDTIYELNVDDNIPKWELKKEKFKTPCGRFMPFVRKY